MGDVINLNKIRKARQRDDAKAKAAENRVRFGQSKTDRETARMEDERTKRDLEGKKLD